MNYQVLDVKVKDTEETAKLYTYFLDNSREIAPERVRPVIVICPGGGYEWVSEREAEPIALKFVGAGYHAVVLHYSVAPAAHYPTALRQLAWTVAHLREHAAEYHIDPNKVVVAGFSAGGHLAASLGGAGGRLYADDGPQQLIWRLELADGSSQHIIVNKADANQY